MNKRVAIAERDVLHDQMRGVHDLGRGSQRDGDRLGPQSKAMMPPLATAPTTAAEVQLPGVPVPMTWRLITTSVIDRSAARALSSPRRTGGTTMDRCCG